MRAFFLTAFFAFAAVPALRADALVPPDFDAPTTAPAGAAWDPCKDPLPTGELSDADLARLIPDGTPGRVTIRWKVESQVDNYGFNVRRTDSEDGEYEKVNAGVIPGDGTTNIPKTFCFVDTPVERGRTYFYYVESVSTQGVVEVLEETRNTKVTVATLDVERERLRTRARAGAAPPIPEVKREETTATAAPRGSAVRAVMAPPQDDSSTTSPLD